MHKALLKGPQSTVQEILHCDIGDGNTTRTLQGNTTKNQRCSTLQPLKKTTVENTSPTEDPSCIAHKPKDPLITPGGTHH